MAVNGRPSPGGECPHLLEGYVGDRVGIAGETLLPGLIDCDAHLTLSANLEA